MQPPLLGISAGDPAGIGPEIAAKALADPACYQTCRPLLVCGASVMRDIVARCGLDLAIHPVNHPAEGRYQPGTLDVLDLDLAPAGSFAFGQIDPACGNAAFRWVEKVIQLALAGEIDATVTGPIHKESLQLAGHAYPGHTEIFGRMTGTRDYAMMLADEGFRVVHVSTHVSLREAIERVKRPRIERVIELGHAALKRMGIAQPRIAVAGLNPHAGEHGLFGREEIDEIIPAIEAAQARGWQVDGPHPPDTIFPKMKGGQYDLVVCMYHDQGHIPTKVLAFNYQHSSGRWEGLSGVNITLGLPIIRVSVDHGTAFDVAGQGKANEESLIHALRYAAAFCQPTPNPASPRP